MRGSDWLIFLLIIVNFNHFFIQPAPGYKLLDEYSSGDLIGYSPRLEAIQVVRHLFTYNNDW